MSRFYLFRVTPPSQSVTVTQSPGAAPVIASSVTKAPAAKEWTSHPNGVYDPDAPNVEFDFMVVDYAANAGGMVFRIDGPSIRELTQASDFSPKPGAQNYLQNWHYQLYGGMSPDGLPLSGPAAGQPKPGLLAAGSVQEVFGNWVGTDMNLSFLTVDTGLQVSPLMLWWQAGQQLSTAISTMLNQAFPGMPQQITLNQNLIAPPGGITEYAQTLSGMSRSIQVQTKGAKYGQPATYPGAMLYIQGGTLIVTDHTQTPKKKPVQLSFESFIGQPVWTGNQIISINLAMRADIQVGDTVELPKEYGQLPGYVTTLAQASNYDMNFKLAMTGKFRVISMRHIGISRSDFGEGWMTIIEATPEKAAKT